MRRLPPSKAWAVSKALGKSLARSAAIVVASWIGFSIAPEVGCLVSLIGSFILLLGSYRREWKLTRFRVFLPPVTGLLCFLVQMTFFSDAAAAWIFALPVAVAGWFLGWVRGKTHEVYAKKGQVFAQRTVTYLSIWVACYCVTQIFGLLRIKGLVVFGLLSGAFSTAMLAAVAIVLLRKANVVRTQQQVRAARALAVIFLLLLLPLSLAMAIPEDDCSDTSDDDCSSGGAVASSAISDSNLGELAGGMLAAGAVFVVGAALDAFVSVSTALSGDDWDEDDPDDDDESGDGNGGAGEDEEGNGDTGDEEDPGGTNAGPVEDEVLSGQSAIDWLIDHNQLEPDGKTKTDRWIYDHPDIRGVAFDPERPDDTVLVLLPEDQRFVGDTRLPTDPATPSTPPPTSASTASATGRPATTEISPEGGMSASDAMDWWVDHGVPSELLPEVPPEAPPVAPPDPPSAEPAEVPPVAPPAAPPQPQPAPPEPEPAPPPDPDVERQAAEALIAGHQNWWWGLDEAELGRVLATMLPDQASLVTSAIRQLWESDRDDVGYEVARNLDDDQIRELTRTEEGMGLLSNLVSECVGGLERDWEEEQVNRILDQIEKPDLTPEVRDPNLPEINLETLTDEQIRNMARDPKGRIALLGAVKDLYDTGGLGERARIGAANMLGGTPTDPKHEHMKRTMEIITAVDNETRQEPPEVAVITILRGSQNLDLPTYDAVEATLGVGGKGHTAVIVNGLVYSFEGGGWKAGQTVDQYMAENNWRPSVVQVLDVPDDGVARLQQSFNDAAGTGAYFSPRSNLVTGDKRGLVCTTGAAEILRDEIPDLPEPGWHPPRLVGLLTDTGRVKETRIYPGRRGHYGI